MSRKWMAAAALLVLMLSVCVLAAAEEPTDPVYPVPGPLEKHEHTVSIKIVDRGYTAHRLNEWCPDCGRLLKERIEGHNFADGVCTVCDWECPHPPEAAEKHYERDGVKPRWDGNYIIGPGWEITECSLCHTELSRVETTVREFHNVHTHFTPVLECLPHDAGTHALIRYCDECGTEVPEYVPHNCPPSDRPYTDEGDPDTHSRLVRCADCGFWVPQQQAHTWVHDSYRKNDTDGGEEGHIEVMKCSVCGALKYEKQPHDAGRVISIWKIDDPEMHKRYLQCSLCKIFYWDFAPHELVHEYYKFDGNNDTHIDMYRCTVCGQMVEKRENHSPIHVTWKNVSDTQDQEIAFCKVCNHNYSLALSAHQFDSFAYHTNGLDKHTVYRTCSKCGTQEKNGKTYIEGHTFSDRTCTKCGQSSVHEEGHIPLRYTGKALLLDADHHVNEGICFLCLASFYDYDHIKTHKIDPLTMKCTACGFLQEGCEHHYGQIAYWTEKGHFFTGNCEKCGKQSTEQYFEYHNMQWESKIYGLQDSETSHHLMRVQKCTVCGYKQVMDFGSRDHRFVQVGNNQRCEKCGYLKKSSCEHTFEYTTDPKKQTETVHYCQLKCTKCGAESFKYEKHDLKPLPDSRYQKINNEIHSNAVRYRCIVCGYETSVKESE